MPDFDYDAAIAALDRLVIIAQSDTGPVPPRRQFSPRLVERRRLRRLRSHRPLDGRPRHRR